MVEIEILHIQIASLVYNVISVYIYLQLLLLVLSLFFLVIVVVIPFIIF